MAGFRTGSALRGNACPTTKAIEEWEKKRRAHWKNILPKKGKNPGKTFFQQAATRHKYTKLIFNYWGGKIPGLFIYNGEPRQEAHIRQRLATYNEPETVEVDGQNIELQRKVEDFAVSQNGDISFTIVWDERIPYQFRGETKYRVQSFYKNFHIVRDRDLYVLVSKGKFNSPFPILKVSELIYGTAGALAPTPIPSDVIKAIENEDANSISAEGLNRISDRDNSVMLYGALDTRGDDGRHYFSRLHESYRDRDKSYSQFSSMSIGCTIYLSGKKCTLSVRGENADEGVAKAYIKDNLLPKLRVTDQA